MGAMTADLEILPLTAERVPDLAALFAQGGDPKWCWYKSPVGNRRQVPLLLPIALAVTVAAALPGVVWIGSARVESDSARQAAFAGEWQTALVGFRSAAQR